MRTSMIVSDINRSLLGNACALALALAGVSGCVAADQEGAEDSIEVSADVTSVGQAMCPVDAECCPAYLCEPPPEPVTGSVFPKYQVLSVIYAPPGSSTGTGAGKSSVSYSNTSSVGVTTTVKNSIESKNSITADATAFGFGLTTTTSANYTSELSHQLQITDQMIGAQSYSGPSAAGIDHNYDVIELLLNPRLDFVIIGKSVDWSEAINPDGHAGNAAERLVIYAGYLNGTWAMPAGIAAELALHGIGPADYATILARDPFAQNAGAAINPSRFVNVGVTFPYTPAPPGGSPFSTTYTVSKQVSKTGTSTSTDQYAVGFTVSASPSFADWIKTGFKAQTTLTWTNSTSVVNTNGITNQASVTVTGPTTGYTGPTNIAVYYDAIYRTFLFAFLPPSAQLGAQGTVLDAAGQPAANQEVSVVVDGEERRTFTDVNGEYRFFDLPAGEARIEANGAAADVEIGDRAVRLDFVR